MKKIINESNELDNYGALTDPWNDDAPVYDYRKLLQYCNEKGIEPKNLSDEEMNLFLIREGKEN